MGEKSNRIEEVDPVLNHVKAVLSWTGKNNALYGTFDLDVSAFLLNAKDKIVRHTDFIWYGNTKSSCGSIDHSGDDTTGDNDEIITVRLSKLPKEIHKVLFVVSIYGTLDLQVFGKTDEANVRIIDVETEEKIASFAIINFEIVNLDLDDAYNDRTVLIGELQRSDTQWSWETIFEGSNTPLEKIAKQYGVNSNTNCFSKEAEKKRKEEERIANPIRDQQQWLVECKEKKWIARFIHEQQKTKNKRKAKADSFLEALVIILIIVFTPVLLILGFWSLIK